jgi:hypothetical protein
MEIFHFHSSLFTSLLSIDFNLKEEKRFRINLFLFHVINSFNIKSEVFLHLLKLKLINVYKIFIYISAEVELEHANALNNW